MLPLQSPEQSYRRTSSTQTNCIGKMGASLSRAPISGDGPTAQAKRDNSVSDVESSRRIGLHDRTCSSTTSHVMLQKKDLKWTIDDSIDSSGVLNSGNPKCAVQRRDSIKNLQQPLTTPPSHQFIQGLGSHTSSQKRNRELTDQINNAKKKCWPLDVSPSLTISSKFSNEPRSKDNFQEQCGVKQIFASPVLNSTISISDKKEHLPSARETSKENNDRKFNAENFKCAQHKSSDERTLKVSRPAERRKSLHKHSGVKLEDYDELFKPDNIIRVRPNSSDPALVKDGIRATTMTANPSPSNLKENPSKKDKLKDLTITKSDHRRKVPPSKTLPKTNLSSRELKLEDKLTIVGTEHKNNKDSLCKKVKEHKNDKVCKSKSNFSSSQTCKDGQSVSSLDDDLESKTTAKDQKPASEVDSLDLDLPLDDCSIHIDSSSDNESLITLEEVMRGPIKPPKIPEESTGPRSPEHESNQPDEKERLPTHTKSIYYLNNLDRMLKDIQINKQVKDTETELLTECVEGRIKIEEYEEAKENQQDNITAEQKEFLQSYTLTPCTFSEFPPGESVFCLEKFGRLFDQDTLQLKKHAINPKGIQQKIFVWSSAAQLRLHLNIGLLQEAYDSQFPCPTLVSLYLFKMMSVHTERMVSDNILRELCSIARTAAFQMVQHGNQQFSVWVPSLAEVTLVFLNMGVEFVTLYPFEFLQPLFTEGDLLISSEASYINKEQRIFPQHNCDNVIKYLSFCMGLCPKVYNDSELLLLLTVVSRIGLDPHYILQSSVELYTLQYKIVTNFRKWDIMLPKACEALTELTDDHHNMCSLVQLLPDSTRGRELSQHLSISMISKLLDGSCKYKITEREFQLTNLSPYLPKMRPSTIVKRKLKSCKKSDVKADDYDYYDQESYYLCYSLMTLLKGASNFQHFPIHQKKPLLILCHDLERHIKCDIRENKNCLYRSRVKDLVARIYTKWQNDLRSSKPLNGKLYDYWLPLALDRQACSVGEQSDGSGGEEAEMETAGQGEVKEEGELLPGSGRPAGHDAT